MTNDGSGIYHLSVGHAFVISFRGRVLLEWFYVASISRADYAWRFRF